MPKWDVGDKVLIRARGVIARITEVKKSCYTVCYEVTVHYKNHGWLTDECYEDYMAHELLPYTSGINLLYD